MKQPLLIYNLRYEKLCDLVSNGEFSARRITESFGLNQITQLSFEIPLQNPNTHYIINENLILFNDEFYRIKTPSVKHNEDGSTVLTVNCSHLSETLQSNVITMDEITPKTVVELMKIALVYNGSTPTLGWSVGNVTVDLTKRRGLERSEQSSFSHLCIIAEKYDGILVFNSQTRKVDLIPRVDIAKPDFELSVYKNLKGIEISYDSSEMVTRLYCFGGNDANGNEINIININPLKKGYVENYDYFFHLGYEPSDILAHPELFIKTSVWRDTNYYLPSDLYDDGIDKLETLAKPKIDVKVEALDLSQFPEYKSIPLSLGEAINVRDEDLGISFICNIIGRTINYDEPHILNIELTNQIDYKNLLSELFTKVSTVGQVISSGANIKGSAIDGINTDQIRDIDAKYASFEYLDANYIDATNLAAQYAKIYDLEATIGNIEILESDLSTIQTLVNGNLTSNNIQSLNLTSANTTIADAMIKEAMIEDLSVNKIMSGDISTNKFRVVSDNNNLLIADNTIQISDNSKVRVQIGKDGLGDYSMYVWDVNGNLMFDATGIKEDAIKSAIIRNDMVSPTANISAEKLDISSLFNVINNDGTHTLKGSKIKLDTQEQTLDIAFNTMSTTIDNNSVNAKNYTDSKVSTATTAINIAQGKINTLISETGITELQNEGTTLYDKYTTTEQDINGIKTIVGEHTSQLDGVNAELEVTQTSIVQTENSIRQDVDIKLTDLNNNITTSYTNKIEQTSDSLNLKINQIEKTYNNSSESTQGNGLPTLENYPAMNWTDPIYPEESVYPSNTFVWTYSTETYYKFLGTVYYDNTNSKAYRFVLIDNIYQWKEITDALTTTILDKVSAVELTTENIMLDVSAIEIKINDDIYTKTQTQSLINQTSNSIVQTVSTTYETKQNALTVKNSLQSQITQTASNIELKVNKNGLISTINQSAEEIKIKANKISFEGMVTANDNFKILEDGSIEAKNGKFSGRIDSAEIYSGGSLTISAWDTYTYGQEFNEVVMGNGVLKCVRTAYTQSGGVYKSSATMDYKALRIKNVYSDNLGSSSDPTANGYFTNLYVNGTKFSPIIDENISKIYSQSNQRRYYAEMNDYREFVPNTSSTSYPFSIGNSSYPWMNGYFKNLYVNGQAIQNVRDTLYAPSSSFNVSINSSRQLIPSTYNSSYPFSLGSSTYRWTNGYIDNLTSTSVSTNSLSTATFRHTGNSIGFFGTNAQYKTTISDLSTGATLTTVVSKVQDLINALQKYGLI